MTKYKKCKIFISLKYLMQVLAISLTTVSAGAHQLVSGGDEFLVNTYTNDVQKNPSITTLNDGGWVVTWVSTVQDGDREGIFGQRYDSGGAKSGSEFQVNTNTYFNQRNPSTSALNDGGWIVIWGGKGTGDNFDIQGQHYDSNGAPVGVEFQVNTTSSFAQKYPSVTAINDGGWLVTWVGERQDGSGAGVFGQRYDSNGVPSGGEFQINTTTVSEQTYPSVTVLTDGGWLVVWQSYGQDGDSYGIYGQRYDNSGISVGSEFQINSYTSDNQQHPVVTALSDGGWVVIWMSDGQDGDSEGIYGQRFGSNGSIVGNEFRVNSFTTGNQQSPSVTTLSDGSWVVTWMSYGQDGDGDGIYGQRYDSSGTESGGEFAVNINTTNSQQEPSITALSDGGWVVAWWSSTGNDIYGRRFNINDNAACPAPTP